MSETGKPDIYKEEAWQRYTQAVIEHVGVKYHDGAIMDALPMADVKIGEWQGFLHHAVNVIKRDPQSKTSQVLKLRISLLEQDVLIWLAGRSLAVATQRQQHAAAEWQNLRDRLNRI